MNENERMRITPMIDISFTHEFMTIYERTKENRKGKQYKK